MCCSSCGSENQRVFYSEINIHFPGLKKLTRTVWAFPTLWVCVDCGFTELQIEPPALQLLNEGSEAEELAA
jgi:hypothetical protein